MSRKFQLCLVLGGCPHREETALRICKQIFDNTPVVISSAALSRIEIFEIVEELEINSDLVLLDYTALDTLSNFTTSLNIIKSLGLKNIAVFTSNFHYRRSKSIARIVFGRYRIRFKIMRIYQRRKIKREGEFKILRDKIRSYIWVRMGIDFYPLYFKFFNKKKFQAVQNQIRTDSYRGKYFLEC